jgi:hypothetical protein
VVVLPRRNLMFKYVQPFFYSKNLCNDAHSTSTVLKVQFKPH